MSTCKRNWVNLRDSYRRSVKRRSERKSGQSPSKVRKWKYEDQMSFLQSHFQGRGTITNIISSVDDYDQDSTHEDEKERAEKTTERSFAATTGESVIKCKRERNAKKLRKSEESASAVLMKYILEKKEEKPNEANVDAFLSGIAVTMKSFSP